LDILDELPSAEEIFIIPVRLDECEPVEERLQVLHRVDLFASYETGLNQILRVLRPTINNNEKSTNNFSFKKFSSQNEDQRTLFYRGKIMMFIIINIIAVLLSVIIHWGILTLIGKAIFILTPLSIITLSYVLMYTFFRLFSEYNPDLALDQFIKSLLAGVLCGFSIVITSCVVYLSPNLIDVKGMVINSRTSEPISQAEVTIGKEKSYTASSGEFRISTKVFDSNIDITVKKSGFSEWTDFLETEQLTENIKVKLTPKIRIFLADFTSEDESSSLKPYETKLPQTMKSAFVECNDMEVVARGENLQKILEEIEYEKNLNELFNPKEIVQTGKMFGANYAITGKIFQMKNTIQIQTEMLNMKYATTELQKDVVVENQDYLLDAARFLSLEMVAKIVAVKIADIKYSHYDYRQIEVEGTNSCIPEGWVIWISVLPSGTDRHYPQVYATVDKENWIAPSIYLGDEGKPEDRERLYHIYAILADQDAHKQFLEYIDTQNYEGLKKLPEGAKICDRREVKREAK